LGKIHPSCVSEVTGRSKIRYARALFDFVCSFTRALFNADDIVFFNCILSVTPYVDLESSSREEFLYSSFTHYFSSEVMQSLSQGTSRDMQRLEKKKLNREAREDVVASVVHSWPQKISQEVALQCFTDYREGTVWTKGSVCAVCSRSQYRPAASFFDVSEGLNDLHLEMLRICDQFVILHCIVQQLSLEFTFGHVDLDGLMLCKEGIICNGDDCQICVCNTCESSLHSNRMPRLALANNLYRGQLPSEFCDLTWVEEMVCALFRTTAHVTRLFQSSDPKNPRVMYGNTCAHAMNVTSTASVLPRTPSDINDALSVVFIGNQKFDPLRIYSLFRVRKVKISRFLAFLKQHNRLYENIDIDLTRLTMFPDDDLLPGVNERVIEHHVSDPSSLLSEESAGFSAHPAEEFDSHLPTSENHVPNFVEKLGVTDPECDTISGRQFVAAAFKNLIPAFDRQPDREIPDLVLHHNKEPITEYHNYALIPGMYPTLFPLE
jgi:hypothetical protein